MVAVRFRETKQARYKIGRLANGAPFEITFPYTPHLLLAGTTGTGKSNTMNCIGGSVADRADLAIIGVDLKRVELSMWEPRLTVFARTPAEADIALADVLELVEWRQHYLESVGRRKWTARDGVFVMLVIDEFARLAGVDAEKLIRAAHDGADSKPIREAKDALANRLGIITAIAQLGRAAGVWLVGATQYPTAEVIDSQIRSQFEMKIMHKVATAGMARVVLGQSFPQITPDSIPVSQRGGFWCVGHPSHLQPVRGRSFEITDEDMVRFERTARHRVTPDSLFGPSRGFLSNRPDQ